MIKFFKQILKKIDLFDKYTNQYLKISHNVEMPALAFTNAGLYYAEIKNYAAAIEKLKTAADMPGNNPKPCISLGILYAKLKEYDKAEEMLKKAISRDSENSHAYSVLSGIYVALNKFEQAEENLKKALKITPSDFELYMNYGILYGKQKKRHKAIEMLRKSKMLNPCNEHVYFLLGVLYFETEKINEAFEEFFKLAKEKPFYKNLNYYIALCYKKEKNYEKTLEYAKNEISYNKSNPSHYILLGQAYLDLGQNEECINTFESGYKEGFNDFDYFLAWGISLIKSNKIAGAKEKIEKALEIAPENPNAIYRLAYCCYKEHNVEKAEELYKKSIKLNATNSYAIAEYGILLYDMQDYENAIKTFFSAINISSDKTYLYFYVANSYYKLGKIKKSIEYYEKTIEYYPQHTEALINYAVALLDTGNAKEGLRKIRTAYQINRNSKKVQLIYALSALKAGLYCEAIEKAEMILTKEEDDYDAKLIKTQALINLYKPAEALKILDTINDKESGIFYFLSYSAYKMLVENSNSNYNENMLSFYEQKLNEKKNEKNEEITKISSFISNTLNINKG